MKRKIKFIALLLIIDIFLLCVNSYIVRRDNYIKNSINEKEILIKENESNIQSSKLLLEEEIKNNELVQKEYNVWIHQNEKLVDILP